MSVHPCETLNNNKDVVTYFVNSFKMPSARKKPFKKRIIQSCQPTSTSVMFLDKIGCRESFWEGFKLSIKSQPWMHIPTWLSIVVVDEGALSSYCTFNAELKKGMDFVRNVRHVGRVLSSLSTDSES